MKAETERVEPRAELVEPVRRVLAWLLAQRDGEGRIVCPEHGIEHTGKNAGVIVMAACLARMDPEADRDALFAVACQQAERLVERLEREGDSTCFTFRPGRHDPYNCSNNVIDGGACSDALAELVLTFGERLSAEQRERYQHACVLHAQTYLRYAILDKAIPAQRAWAMTGVAGGWRLAGHEVLELAVMEGVGILEGLQYDDGSYPYHPLEGHPGHPGASDVSSFYQSRVSAFLMFSLERMGRDPRAELFRAPIWRGLQFLAALQAPNGIKTGQVEAKPWYWGAPFEVASHPFDVYALARGWRLFGVQAWGLAARRAFGAWAERLTSAGRPRSHLAEEGWGTSYQCAVFWAGHASWMARALPDLERILRKVEDPQDVGAAGGGLDLAVQHFPDAALTRLEDGAVVAWVRGARPAFNLHHGSPRGSGLVRVYDKLQQRELLRSGPTLVAMEGEWRGWSGAPSPRRGWRSGGKELRFSWWLARNARRCGRRRDAMGIPLRVLGRGVLAPSLPRVSSSWCLDPSIKLRADGVDLVSRVAHCDGISIADGTIVGSYRLNGDGLDVHEEQAGTPAAIGLSYHLPEAARDVQWEAHGVRFHLGG